jgi:hypothetical protein
VQRRDGERAGGELDPRYAQEGSPRALHDLAIDRIVDHG